MDGCFEGRLDHPGERSEGGVAGGRGGVARARGGVAGARGGVAGGRVAGGGGAAAADGDDGVGALVAALQVLKR